ncbi:MAG: hypothetical protein JEZ14_23815 [Marinilabiliaceae bacterium]|nr:hypothetical protein [Marinilabiliaceae bacterium]
MTAKRKRCKYKDCEHYTHTESDDFCIFHLEDKKDVTESQYEKLLTELFNKGYFDYKGYIFPWKVDLKDRNLFGADFTGAIFKEGISIENAELQGSYNFSDVVFKKHSKFVRINQQTPTKQCSFEFINAIAEDSFQFIINKITHQINFRGFRAQKGLQINHIETGTATYLDNMVIDHGFQFVSNVFNESVYFRDNDITGRFNADSTKFNNFLVFKDSTFNSDVTFNGTSFLFTGGGIIENCTFNDTVSLSKNKIVASLSIDRINFGEFGSFLLDSTEFNQVEGENEKLVSVGSISFKQIIFSEFKTVFKNINYNVLPPVVLIDFDHCELKNVYFENMTFNSISLFTSNFKDSRFIQCWEDNIGRIQPDNFLLEESYLKTKEKTKEYKKLKEIDELEVSHMYSDLKFAYDANKKYHVSGEFFFKELELKKKFYLKYGNKRMYLLYWVNKYFTWFGQRPLITGLYVLFCFLMFTIYNLMNGLIVKRGSIENIIDGYVFSFDKEGISNLLNFEFWENFGYASIYSLNRVLPFNFTRFYEQKVESIISSPWHFILSIFYTFFCTLFIYYTLIGLRRHFKRF